MKQILAQLVIDMEFDEHGKVISRCIRCGERVPLNRCLCQKHRKLWGLDPIPKEELNEMSKIGAIRF